MFRAQYERFWAELLEQGCIDFSGVLHYAALILERHHDVATSIASVFGSFLIDEYQDTSSAQLRVLKPIAAAGKSSWMLFGDLNQSIYGFGGVSRAALIAFATERECTQTTFGLSYRCAASICEQASNLIDEPRMICANEKIGAVITSFGSVEASVSAFVDELRARGIPFSDAAIIAAQPWPLDASADTLGRMAPPVPWARRYPISGSTTVSRLVSSVLSCVYHPQRVDHVVEASAVLSEVISMVGILSSDVRSDGPVLRMVDACAAIGLDEIRFTQAASVIEEVVIATLPPQLSEAIKAIFAVSVRPKLLEKSPLLDFNGHCLARLFCKCDAITLATIHGAKGLEFRAVLLAGYEDGSIPHVKATDVAEETRKAYVAVTRASELLMYGARESKVSAFWSLAMRQATYDRASLLAQRKGRVII